jgi:acetyltransferase-like isoleucine patch superfamily enzyme
MKSPDVERPVRSFQSMGQQVTIWPQAKIVNPERIVIGDRVIIDDFVLLIGGEETQLGSFVHLGAFSSIMGGGKFVIEDFAGLSGGVRIYTGNEQYGGECMTNPTVPFPFRIPVRGTVVVKKHAIIGANSVILPGVTIGEGAVIGACSLVTKDCVPWSINFGSPARKIGIRPAATILEFEKQLRAKHYAADGKFIVIADDQ